MTIYIKTYIAKSTIFLTAPVRRSNLVTLLDGLSSVEKELYPTVTIILFYFMLYVSRRIINVWLQLPSIILQLYIAELTPENFIYWYIINALITMYVLWNSIGKREVKSLWNNVYLIPFIVVKASVYKHDTMYVLWNSIGKREVKSLWYDVYLIPFIK